MRNKPLFILFGIWAVLSAPARIHATCWKYHVDRVFPCSVSIVPAPVKNADANNCPAKGDLDPHFHQYTCDYIGVGGIHYSLANVAGDDNAKSPPVSQNIHDFNKAALFDQKKTDQEDMIDMSQRAYENYLDALSDFLKRTDPREIRKDYPLKIQLALASRELSYFYVQFKLPHVLRPFLGKEIVAEYFSNAKTGVRQNTWHWKPYLSPISKRAAELQKIKNRATQAYLRQKRSEIAKELGTKYGAEFKTGYEASETAVDARYSKGKIAQPLILKKPVDSAIKAPPSPAFLPDNLKEISQRNYFRRAYSLDPYDPKGKNVNLGDLRLGLERVSEEAKVAIWHALGMTKTLGNPEQKVPFVFEQYNGTCGIAALTQYMQAHGQKVTVRELSKISRDRGISDFSGDNPNEWGGTYSGGEGRAAQPYGYHSDDSFWKTFPPGKANKSDPRYDRYIKRYQSQDQKRLEEAIRRHQGAVVSVASKFLWGPSVSKGPAYADHYVYVTGEEINASTHKIVGYYINDSGTGEGGRFVDAKTFLRAWIYGGDEIATIAPIPGLARR